MVKNSTYYLKADGPEVKDYFKERRQKEKQDKKEQQKEKAPFSMDPELKQAIREQSGYEHLEEPVIEALNKLCETNERQDIEIEDYKITAYKIEAQDLMRIDIRRKKK
jgi:predicted transposase YbfD/YdcC